MKLYRYYEDYGRMGSIEGLFFLTEEKLNFYKKYTNMLYWDELLGKHSEGTFDFSDETITAIDIPEDAAQILRDAIGSDVISGPFDFEYFDEIIEMNGDDEDDS